MKHLISLLACCMAMQSMAQNAPKPSIERTQANNILIKRDATILKTYALKEAPYLFSETGQTGSEEEIKVWTSDWDSIVKPLVSKDWESYLKTDSLQAKAQFTNLPNVHYTLTQDGNKLSMRFCLVSNNSEDCYKDDGLVINSSKREFMDYYKKLADGFYARHRNNLPINTQHQLLSYSNALYDMLQKIANNATKSGSTGNVKSTQYNDSLSATIKLNREIPYYLFVDSNNTYLKKGVLQLESASVYINDGFIYNISFNMDKSSADNTEAIPNQAFGTRYNLKNNSFVNYMLARPSHGNRGAYRENVPVNSGVNFLTAARSLNVLVLTKDKRKYIDKGPKNAIKRYVVFPSDLIEYQKPRSAPNNIFTAKETLLNFNSKASFDTIRNLKEKSLYSFVNLDLFTDLIGLFGEEKPNGLIQTELKVQFYGFRRPFKQKNPSNVRVVPLDKGELFFRLSKLDNNQRFLDVLTDTGAAKTKYIHQINLLQYQSTYAGIRANLIDLEYRGGSTSFTSEVAFIRTGLRDTLLQAGSSVKVPKEFSVNTFSFSVGANFKFRSASFLDIDISPRLIWLTPRTGNIQISNSEYSTVFPNSYISSVGKNISKSVFTLRGMVTINLNDDKTRRLILRGEHFNERGNTRNNFWTMQVGYSADLNQFIKFKQ